MNPIKTANEIAVNTFYGSKYHDKKVVPRLISFGKSWENWSEKKACLILSYDIDEKTDIDKLPKLLDLLDKYNIKAGFAAIGLMVEEQPELFADILKRGHEIINHTYSHPNSVDFNNDEHFDKITPKRRFLEIKKCHDIVKKKLDYNMIGFRIPHFGNQFIDDIYPMLKRLGYKYSSSAVAIRTDTQGFPYIPNGMTNDPKKIWELPLVCCPRHPFCIFDTSHAFRSRFARHSSKEYIETFEKFLDFGIKNHVFLNFYHDPQDIDSLDYEKILKIISKRKKYLMITTYKELIERIRSPKH